MARRSSTRTAPRLSRCLTETSVCSLAHEYSRRFGAGELVDLSEEIAAGLSLRDLIREDCFQDAGGIESLEGEGEVEDGDTHRP